MAAFGPLLRPADLARQPGCAGTLATEDALLESLFRFEGALAWEDGQPRHSVPPGATAWVREAWLAGWDDADSRFYQDGLVSGLE